MHKQAPYARFAAPGGLPAGKKAAGQVLSPLMHAYLKADVQDKIIAAVRGFNR